jgi:hypothetical protein
MTIADEIAREFAKNLVERRAAARQRLVVTAADTEELIRSKRPLKSKEKTITEEAHPGEVFVAESDGLGGLVGNLEQVHQQIMDALNRRPSAFPYQGLVANAMLDFHKTAEVLESHDLHDEAETVRKAALDWLMVLRRRGGVDAETASFFSKKVADIIDPVERLMSPAEGVPDFGFDAERAAKPTTVTVKPTATTNPADFLSPPRSANAAAAAALDAGDKAIVEAAKAKGAMNTLKGMGSKVLTPVSVIYDLYSAVAAARRGDWGEVWTMAAGAAGGVAVEAAVVAAASGTLALAPALGAASTGAAILSAIKFALIHTSQEDIDTDLAELEQDIDGELKDDSYDPSKIEDPEEKEKASSARYLLEVMKTEIAAILRSREALREESRKSTSDLDIELLGAHLFNIEESNRKLEEAFNKFAPIGSELDLEFLRGTLGFGYPKIKGRIGDVAQSLQNFDKEMKAATGKFRPDVDNIIAELKKGSAVAKKLIIELREGEVTGSSIRREMGVSPRMPINKEDPAHVKETQRYFGLPQTGEWDNATMKALQKIRYMWINHDVVLKDDVTIDALKESTVDELEKLSELWRIGLIGTSLRAV